MSISTKTGDTGETALMFGRRVSKAHPRVEANGIIDEMNAALGLARVAVEQALAEESIAEIQAQLVVIMGEMATLPADLPRYEEKGFERTTPGMVDWLSAKVAELEADYGVDFKTWAVPGAAGSSSAAALDLARTICRRAERAIAALQESGEIENPVILQYFNRLSDLCWLIARFEEGVQNDRQAQV